MILTRQFWWKCTNKSLLIFDVVFLIFWRQITTCPSRAGLCCVCTKPVEEVRLNIFSGFLFTIHWVRAFLWDFDLQVSVRAQRGEVFWWSLAFAPAVVVDFDLFHCHHLDRDRHHHHHRNHHHQHHRNCHHHHHPQYHNNFIIRHWHARLLHGVVLGGRFCDERVPFLAVHRVPELVIMLVRLMVMYNSLMTTMVMMMVITMMMKTTDLLSTRNLVQVSLIGPVQLVGCHCQL